MKMIATRRVRTISSLVAHDHCKLTVVLIHRCCARTPSRQLYIRRSCPSTCAPPPRSPAESRARRAPTTSRPPWRPRASSTSTSRSKRRAASSSRCAPLRRPRPEEQLLVTTFERRRGASGWSLPELPLASSIGDRSIDRSRRCAARRNCADAFTSEDVNHFSVQRPDARESLSPPLPSNGRALRSSHDIRISLKHCRLTVTRSRSRHV